MPTCWFLTIKGSKTFSTATAPLAVEAEMPRVIQKIVKRIQYQQSSAPWTIHSFLLLTFCSIPVFSNLYRVFQNYIPEDNGNYLVALF